MKGLTGDKVRQMDTKELMSQAQDMAGQLFHFRLQIRMGQMDGLKKFRALKKDRARILTVLRERQLAEAASARPVGKG